MSAPDLEIYLEGLSVPVAILSRLPGIVTFTVDDLRRWIAMAEDEMSGTHEPTTEQIASQQ